MTRMSEESTTPIMPEKPEILVPNLYLNDLKPSGRPSSSNPSSPTGGLRKAASVRSNCLCSPTTHVGSFRCRYHRNSGLKRTSLSVGAKLSELGAKPSDS